MFESDGNRRGHNMKAIRTMQVVPALALLQFGQPFVPSSLSHVDYASFQEFLPIVNEQRSEIRPSLILSRSSHQIKLSCSLKKTNPTLGSKKAF